MMPAHTLSRFMRGPLLQLLGLTLAHTALAQGADQGAEKPETPEEKPEDDSEEPQSPAAVEASQASSSSETTKPAETTEPAEASQPTEVKPKSKSTALEKMAKEEEEGDSNDASDSKQEKEKDGSAEEKPPPPPAPKIDYSKLPWTYHQKRFDLGAGLLIGWARDPAFDLFQSKNAYATWEIRGAVAFWASGPLSLAVTGKFNNTSIEGEVRGLPSYLTLNRAHLGGEARYHIVPRAYVYGRLDLGAFLAHSRLGEADAPTRMELKDAGFSGGLHLGGAVRVAGSPDGRSRAPRLHLFAEGGLQYDSPLTLTYEMASEGALRPAPVELGTLSAGGPRIALGALVSY